MTAHYFKSGKNHILIISSDSKPVGTRYELSSKREVRNLAKELNATPHNF